MRILPTTQWVDLVATWLALGNLIAYHSAIACLNRLKLAFSPL